MFSVEREFCFGDLNSVVSFGGGGGRGGGGGSTYGRSNSAGYGYSGAERNPHTNYQATDYVEFGANESEVYKSVTKNVATTAGIVAAGASKTVPGRIAGGAVAVLSERTP